MFDPEREQLRKTYQLCRLGFGINAMALVLACFTSLLALFGNFEPNLLFWFRDATWFQWLDAPIVWGCLIGTTLLWGRWDNPSWQRRSGLLLVMCLVDVGLWFVSSGETLDCTSGKWAIAGSAVILAKPWAGRNSLCCPAWLATTWFIWESSTPASRTSRFDRWPPRVPWSGCCSFASKRIGGPAGPCDPV